VWFVLDRVDLDYVKTAPHHVCREIGLDVSPARAFEALTDHRWLEWFPDLREITWNPPRGVGGTRYVRLGHAEAHETFLAWEPARRLTFSVDRSTVPVIRALLVDFQLAPILDGSRTRIEVCWHYTVRTWWRPLHGLMQRHVQKTLSAALAGLKNFAEK
jgi:hypothetical protein